MNCKKCQGEMKPSKAIVCRATGMSDFIGQKEAVTMSTDPKQPVLVECMKCEVCGWSVSEPHFHFDEKCALVDGA